MQVFNALMPVNAFLECEGKSFRIKSGQVTEAICRSFDAQLSFSTYERYDANTFLGKFCTLSVEDTHGEKRTWVGECNEVTSSTEDGTEWHYSISFESILGRLKKTKVHFRTEAEVNLKDWVKATFKRHGINAESLDWRCHFNEVRPRLIQVQQSDYDHLLKILAQENIILWPSTSKPVICFANDPAQWAYGPIERIFYTGINDLIQHGGEKLGVFDYQDIYQQVRVLDLEDEKEDWENKPPERLYSGVPYILEGMGGPALKPCKNMNYDRKSMEALFHRRAISEQEANAVYRYLDASSNAIAVAVGNWISLVDVAKDNETRGRVTYVKHELLSSGKTLRYQNRMLIQPAMSPWRAVSPLKQTLPLVMQAHIEGGGSAPLLDQFGEELVSFPGDAAEKPVPFSIPRMRSYVNNQGGMSFPLGHRTEVLISFLYGEADLPIIVGAVPNSDTPSPVNQSNPFDNILSTRSGHRLRLNDEPGLASVGLETSPTHGMWLQNGKGISLRSEGGFVLDVKNRILCQIGKTWNMLAGGSMLCTANVSQKLETTEGDIVMSTPLLFDVQVKKHASLYIRSNMKMRDKHFKMKVDKDAMITIKNGDARLQIKGAVAIQSGDGIKIIGSERLVIQSGEEGSGMIMEPGHITLYGKNLVGVEADELALNGNVSFGTAQRASSPIQPLTKTIEKETSEEIKKLVLHQINVSKPSEFYGKTVAPGELDEFYFHIAEGSMTLEDFVKNLYVDPEEAHVSNLREVNPHVRGAIEPGQMVYVTNASGAVFQKFKSDFARSAGVIDSLRLQMPVEDVACFAQNFALLGSFASSAGAKEGVYIAKSKSNTKTLAEKTEGLIPFATEAFLQYLAGSISTEIEANKLANPKKSIWSSELWKERNARATKMMNDLIGDALTTTSMKIDAVLKASNVDASLINFIKREWVPPNIGLIPLNIFYECVQLSQKAFDWWGNLHLMIDIGDKKKELELACMELNEKECRRLNVEHWSEFAGKTIADIVVSKSLGIVYQVAGKNSKNRVISVAAIGAGAVLPHIQTTPDDIGKSTKETALLFHDLYYGDESEKNIAAKKLKEKIYGIFLQVD